MTSIGLYWPQMASSSLKKTLHLEKHFLVTDNINESFFVQNKLGKFVELEFISSYVACLGIRNSDHYCCVFFFGVVIYILLSAL